MRFTDMSSVFEDSSNIYNIINESFGTGVGNPNIRNNFSNGGFTTTGRVKKPKGLSKLLKSLSHYGMNYDDDIYKNMQAVPADPILQKDLLPENTMSIYSSISNWKIKPEEERSFSEKTLTQRRDFLRQMSLYTELEDIIDKMANESIVGDENDLYICQPFLDNAIIQNLEDEYIEHINTVLQNEFIRLYNLLQWKQRAWYQYKRFLIDGVLAFEIVYDDLQHPKFVKAIIELDPCTLTRVVENGVTYWVQYKDTHSHERRLLDSQVIYIKFEDSGVNQRQSYLERLIRPFNIYRIIEQAQIIWTVTQSSFKTMFTIPVGGMNRAKGRQTLAEAMNRYKEDISFNNETGELKINGRVNLPFNKEYWMPENENGTPRIETLTDSGPTLSDNDQLNYFLNKLYRASQIPASRFSADSQATWFGNDATQALREEIDFSRFVNRVRGVFAEVLLKPLRIQLSLSIPKLNSNYRLIGSVGLRFNSYNMFEEMMNIEVMTKRLEFITNMKDSLSVMDDEGNENPYFDLEFLITKYLKMSESDLALNKSFKDKSNSSGEEDDESDEDDESSDDSGFGMDDEDDDDGFGGDDESEDDGPEPEAAASDSSDEIDAEMQGDVQPEHDESPADAPDSSGTGL